MQNNACELKQHLFFKLFFIFAKVVGNIENYCSCKAFNTLDYSVSGKV